MSSGKGWASFTFLFCLFEGFVENLRGKEDKWNTFAGGFFTSSLLQIKSTIVLVLIFRFLAKNPMSMFKAGLSGGMFTLVFYNLGVFNMFGRGKS